MDFIIENKKWFKKKNKYNNNDDRPLKFLNATKKSWIGGRSNP